MQRLFARFEQRGADGLLPDYARCGRQQARQAAPEVVERLRQMRRDHPRWGSVLLRLRLEEEFDGVPCARTLRRHLHQAGLQPAPAGRPPSSRAQPPRGQSPHQGWQVDASEGLPLQSGRRACWMRVVDECSGAFLQTFAFAHARWELVDRYAIQDAYRAAFARWGLPQWLRQDNGYPWGSSGDFAPEMALWLLGLGIEMYWIDPACPQQNGVVERAQGTGQNWIEPQTCADVAVLQQRCDAFDQLQRERYPYRDKQSRWQVYPGLRQSSRPYRRSRERLEWDVAPVLAFVSQQVVRRRVDCTGSVSLYHRSRYVGKPYIGTDVYVSLDPSGPTWVFADVDGRELRTHAADELTAERICGLSVATRKGKKHP